MQQSTKEHIFTVSDTIAVTAAVTAVVGAVFAQPPLMGAALIMATASAFIEKMLGSR